MATVKTAISIQESLFNQVNDLAEELQRIVGYLKPMPVVSITWAHHPQ